MSAAQEDEIRQLTAELEAATAARHEAESRAESLQAALFESHLKARAAIEQCRKDALEVAVEEACKEHFQSMAALDKLMRRSVSQISADRALLLSVRASLHELRDLADAHANLVADAALEDASSCNQIMEETSFSSAQSPSETTSSTVATSLSAVSAAAAATNLAERVRATMRSNDMALFLDDAPIPEAPTSLSQEPEPTGPRHSTARDTRTISPPTKGAVPRFVEEKTEPSSTEPARGAPGVSLLDPVPQPVAYSAQDGVHFHEPEEIDGDVTASSSRSTDNATTTSAIQLSDGSQEFQYEPPVDGLVTADTDSDTEGGCESGPKFESGRLESSEGTFLKQEAVSANQESRTGKIPEEH